MKYRKAGRDVDRRGHIDRADFYSNYLGPRIPLIVTGPAEEWLQKWTWDYLTEVAGDVEVAVQDPTGAQRVVRIGQYIQYAKDPQQFDVPAPMYLSGWDFRGARKLSEEYRRPGYVTDWFDDFSEDVRPGFRWLFIGTEGTGTKLHVDTSGTHAWLTQVIGKKRWLLFAPDELQSWKGLDAFEPDFERYPDAEDAQPYVAELAPGETIFVPYGWLHQVQNLGPSLAVTENFVNETNLVDCYREISVHPDAVRARLTSLSLEKARRMAGSEHGDPVAEIEARGLSELLGFRLQGLREEIEQLQEGLDGLRAAAPELVGASG